jgi:hypothetical protein
MIGKPTFSVTVENIGAFTFRSRSIGDEIKIMAAYDALLGGLANPSSYLDSVASALSTYQVLAVAWPTGWAPAEVAQMDAKKDDRIGDLLRVFGALSLREDQFRPEAARRFKSAGQGNGEQPGGVVPPPLQPTAD